MKKLTASIALFSLFSLLIPSFATAAAYMKLGDIKGEAIDVQSVRWMAPESVSKKEYSRSANTKRGTLTLTKEIDKSTPKLAEMLNSGGAFEEITISEGEKNYLLKNVKVVTVQKKGKQEVVTLRFAHRQEFGPTQQRAGSNHNTTRSNKTQPVQDAASAQDYNSSRSNNTASAASAAPAQDYNSSRSNN